MEEAQNLLYLTPTCEAVRHQLALCVIKETTLELSKATIIPLMCLSVK